MDEITPTDDQIRAYLQRRLAENARQSPKYNGNKTRCVNGHDFTPENTYWRPNGAGRDCRTCTRDRWRAWKARKKTGHVRAALE